MMIKTTAKLAAVAALLLGSVGAQQTCGSTNNCNTCLENPSCVFAVGTCNSECLEPENGATCYSIQNDAFADVASGEDLCALYDSDNSRCTAQKSCQDCTNTLKSDGNSCQWYVGVYENGDGACFGGGTGPYGPGALVCEDDATEPPVETDPPTTTPETDAPTPAATTPAPTPAPTDEADDETVAPTTTMACVEGSDCSTCLAAGCAWFPLGLCSPTCADLQDADCYSAASFPDLDADGICEAAATNAADRELCFAVENCGDCTATVKSDGSTCQWYIDEETGVDWCQAGGCDQDGICGLTICPGQEPVVTEPPEVATMAPTQEDIGMMMNDTNTSDWECGDFDAFGSEGCAPCLSSPKNCAWVLESCVTSCDVIADAPCVDASTFRDTPIEQVCAATGIQQEDVALCGSKNYCFTCTSTTKSDGSTCTWYVDGEQEWCGAGGCNENGVCGSNDESICQQPEAPEEVPDTPVAPPTEAPAVVSSANQRNVALVSMVAACMTLARL